MSVEIETVATGLALPEAPVLEPDGGWLLVEMGAGRAGVARIAPGTRKAARVIEAGRPNGVAVGLGGRLWIADTDPPALHRATPQGDLELSLMRAAGVPLLFPNDLCFGPDGALYLTDSGILLEDWAPGGILIEDWPAAKTDGRVFRIDPVTLAASCLDQGLGFPNGIAFGPDGNLYVNEMLSGAVYRYAMGADGRFGERQPFGETTAPEPPSTFKGPDGMAFSADGRLWVTHFGAGEIGVLDPRGEMVERFPTGGAYPSNCAFGPPGEGSLYVTECEHGTLERYGVGAQGAPVHAEAEND